MCHIWKSVGILGCNSYNMLLCDFAPRYYTMHADKENILDMKVKNPHSCVIRNSLTFLRTSLWHASS
jgi:hypothetical protein